LLLRFQADYRQDGNQLLICCSVDGDVKGFTPAGQEIQGNLMDVNVDQETIRELTQKKQVFTDIFVVLVKTQN
jgi:Bardet-Biedl syndrome 2 protein